MDQRGLWQAEAASLGKAYVDAVARDTAAASSATETAQAVSVASDASASATAAAEKCKQAEEIAQAELDKLMAEQAEAKENVTATQGSMAALGSIKKPTASQQGLLDATKTALEAAESDLSELDDKVAAAGLALAAKKAASTKATEAEQTAETALGQAKAGAEVASMEAESAAESLSKAQQAAAESNEQLELAEETVERVEKEGAEKEAALAEAREQATEAVEEREAEHAAAADAAKEAQSAATSAATKLSVVEGTAKAAMEAVEEAEKTLAVAKSGRVAELEAKAEAKAQEVLRLNEQADLAHERTEASNKAQSEEVAQALVAADTVLNRELELWEDLVSELATKETIMCSLDARIAEVKADILAKVAAHDALQAAAAALAQAVAKNQSKGILAAALEVEKAGHHITQMIGDPEASRKALAQELAQESVPPASEEAAPAQLALDFSPPSPNVCLMQPVVSGVGEEVPIGAPMVVYVPGLDGTGQGVRRQMRALVHAGYDVRCVYIPPKDRSTWQQLASTVLPLIEAAAKCPSADSGYAAVTLVSESFFAPLALRLAAAAPSLITRLTLINPSTHFTEERPALGAAADVAAGFGLLEMIPGPMYQAAQDMVQSLLVQRKRVNEGISAEELTAHCYPVDIPAATASWRLSLLRSSSLPEDYIQTITQPTLIIVSGQDVVNPSLEEGARLHRLLPNSNRIVFPDSGHTLLLEDEFDLADVMDTHGFHPTAAGAGKEDEAAAVSSVLFTKGRRSFTGHGSNEDMDSLGRMIGAWKALTSPMLTGVKNLPDPMQKVSRPVLFVGNHTSLGMYDLPLLVHELYLRGFSCRALAHPIHWLGPTGSVIERFGGAKATPYEAHQLLKDKEHLLLFPGGKGEVTTDRSGQKFRLHWREHADYVAMAQRFNAIIVPFAALGANDNFTEPAKLEDLLSGPAGPLVRSLIGEINLEAAASEVNPIAALPELGLPGLPLPSVQRVYVHFCEPVDTADFSTDDEGGTDALVAAVHAAVEGGVQRLMETRATDPDRDLHSRLMGSLGNLMPQYSRLARSYGSLVDGIVEGVMPAPKKVPKQ